MEQNYKILIVDDDASIRKFLKLSLENSSYSVTIAENGKEALKIIQNDKPNIVILDLNLPDYSGKELLQLIKKDFSIPVIMLTVEDSDEQKVELLDLGADDYLTKPFSIQELLARIRVVIRHYFYAKEEPIFRTSNIVIDFNTRTVTKDEQVIKLTAIEYEIFAYLAKNAGKVVTQQQLLKQVWGPSLTEQSHYLRIYIAQLRKKLEKDPGHPEIIITETGVGHRLLRI